ncbi:enoyl-CoA hydratase/isomerase family protein [Halopenitus persicus]|uniref:enoyl-CoA hydratase/isomerase family protein n=1 Tax=Halopenitus persicus TaxID=1048396 RepID=UPI000BBAC704|nr:enoyl-CoA hydratase-related protein [Halopenitus persicus]
MRITDGDGVRTVTFDRPDSKNAFTEQAARDLASAIDGASTADHDAIVLTGEGDAFSAGGDIEAMAAREETAAESFERVQNTLGRVVEAAMTSPVPIVAKVNGDAVGAGLAVTAVSDFAYAAADATFGCAFVRVGLVPDTGGTFLLPKLIGLRAAKRLAFTADFFGAAEAAELGLINEAVPADELDATVDDLLETLGKRPSETIGLAKRAMHENLGTYWREALEQELLTQSLAYGTSDHEEGVSAFLEGRSPDFS